jgi:hypothetical protein
MISPVASNQNRQDVDPLQGTGRAHSLRSMYQPGTELIEEQNSNLSSALRSLISSLRSLEVCSVGLRFVISLPLARVRR